MTRNPWVCALATAALGFWRSLGADEIGDVDGDGRVSIADVIHQERGLPPAPGSLDSFFAEEPCAQSLSGWLSSIIFLQSLSRNIEGSLPHWIPSFSMRAPQDPLPPDPRLLVRLEPVFAPGGESDAAEVVLTLNATAPVRAFSLVLDSGGDVLRVPHEGQNWNFSRWNQRVLFSWEFRHDTGDVRVYVTEPAFLISGGKYVVTFNLGDWYEAVPPGEHTVRTKVRLRKGASAGDHALAVLPGSEVLFEDGTLASPLVEAGGALSVGSDVVSGWDEGLPPIEVDPVERKILGKVEFRVTEAEGFPGDEVVIRIQMRTETPLNWFGYQLFWPDAKLTCVPDHNVVVPSVFVNPEEGTTYTTDRAFCSDQGLWGRYFHEAVYYLAGWISNLSSGHEDRPLEYFQSLDEWVDVTELTLRISEGAAGGTEIPLVFQPYDWDENFFVIPYPPQLVPYASLSICNETEGRLARPERWRYDVSYHPGAIRVLGDGGPIDPPPPPDAGIRLILGSATGQPGEVVDLPVFAASGDPWLSILRLVVETDPEVAVVESLDLEVLDLETAEAVIEPLPRGQGFVYEVCGPGGRPSGDCTYGIPFAGKFHESEDRFTFVDISIRPPKQTVTDYPGSQLREIGRLRVRLQPDTSAAETAVRFSSLRRFVGGFETTLESGGELVEVVAGSAAFAPASETTDGLITILGRGFRRGDANADGKADLSDAVTTLQYLFSGGAAPCLDAADADDSGAVEITDAIFLLGALFLGNQVVPAPHPECGVDETRDGLGCGRGCS